MTRSDKALVWFFGFNLIIGLTTFGWLMNQEAKKLDDGLHQVKRGEQNICELHGERAMFDRETGRWCCGRLDGGTECWQ